MTIIKYGNDLTRCPHYDTIFAMKKYIILFGCLACFVASVSADDGPRTRLRIKDRTVAVNRRRHRRTIGQTEPLALLVNGVVAFFQTVISPQDGPRCKFYPVCSAYGKRALKHHGPIIGPFVAADRVMRCNPWNDEEGDDPLFDNQIDLLKQFNSTSLSRRRRFRRRTAP